MRLYGEKGIRSNIFFKNKSEAPLIIFRSPRNFLVKFVWSGEPAEGANKQWHRKVISRYNICYNIYIYIHKSKRKNHPFRKILV